MPPTPRLLALGTAVPPFVLDQTNVQARAAHLLKPHMDLERLLPVFANAGIDRRYSCVPIDWYAEPHGWTDRTKIYVENAVALLERIALDCLAQAGLSTRDIDAIVVASTTGIATPSLDALIVERLSLRRDIKRLPIFGLGCAGGVTGLARAADLARADPDSRVLFLAVELCALSFRKNDLTRSNIVATALFGDGAAGAILSCRGEGPRVGAAGEYTWPDSLDVMGWDVEEDGLKARFSQTIPTVVAGDFRRVLLEFLDRHGLTPADFDDFACHPGGAKVIDALEMSIGLPPGALVDSRSVLRDYGNMSAVTALFVLQRMGERIQRGRTLLSAMGPGFSATFLVLDGR